MHLPDNMLSHAGMSSLTYNHIIIQNIFLLTAPTSYTRKGLSQSESVIIMDDGNMLAC